MGTNYYHRTDICPCCSRFKKKHIGKSSLGWEFSFQGYTGYEDNPKIQSFEDWKRELQADGKIFDEYGKEMSFEDFVQMVEDKKANKGRDKDKPNLNHYDYCKKESQERGYSMDNDWKDKEGHSFCSSDFS